MFNGPQSCDSVSLHCNGIQGDDQDKFFNLTDCDILDDDHVVIFLQVAWKQPVEQYPVGIQLWPISLWHRCVCVCVCVCARACTHAHTHVLMLTCVFVFAHTCTHMHTHSHSEAAKFHIFKLSVVLDEDGHV